MRRIAFGLALLALFAGDGVREAGAQRAIAPRPTPPEPALPKPANPATGAPAGAAEARAESVLFALTDRPSGRELGLAVQARRDVRLRGGRATRPRICFECAGETLAVRFEIPLLEPGREAAREGGRFRFETPHRRPFYVRWPEAEDASSFATAGVAWWSRQLQGEKSLLISPPGELGVSGRLEFSLPDFERTRRAAAENCRLFAAEAPGGGRGPDVAPVILGPLDDRYPGRVPEDRTVGRVVVLARIDSLGAVTDARPLLSDPDFDARAERALRKAVVRPAQVDGVGKATWVALPVRFVR